MKRDTADNFVPNWEAEAKQRVSITLTATAWQLLDEEAQKRGISPSEVIEQVARSFSITASTYDQSLAPASDSSNELDGSQSAVCTR